MPNLKPNRWWQWCRRWPKKSNRIDELREWSVELAKTERANRTKPNWIWVVVAVDADKADASSSYCWRY
jgi:hypothetical protein